VNLPDKAKRKKIPQISNLTFGARRYFYIFNFKFCRFTFKNTFLLFCLGLLILTSCNNQEKNINLSFYHWQTHFQLTETEWQYLQDLSVNKLYIKFFDVDWDEATAQAVPLATLQTDSLQTRNLQIVPTIFITNRTFSNLSGSDIDSLALRIHRKIFQIAEKLPNNSIQEIQIDCDWSETTREKYFQLLQHLHSSLQLQKVLLSVTIRLHQIRYLEQTGVPPADRGMLMCYNTGEVTSWTEENSILSSRTASPYLSRLKTYPLPLDLALPIFAWGVLFRDGEMIRLINGLRAEDLKDTTRFTSLASNRFQVVKSTYLKGYYLYQGDRLRLESINSNELQENVALLRPRWPTNNFHLTFYHLDTATIKYYPHLQLDSIKLSMMK
jgi:hypothetical protein